MPTIHNVETVRGHAIPRQSMAPHPATAPAEAKAVAKVLALIALAVISLSAAAVALTAFIVLPPPL